VSSDGSDDSEREKGYNVSTISAPVLAYVRLDLGRYLLADWRVRKPPYLATIPFFPAPWLPIRDGSILTKSRWIVSWAVLS